MENNTVNLDILQLEGLELLPGSSIPAFVIILLFYIFIIMANICMVTLITTDSSLHQPMYLLYCNMSVNDVFGASTIIPHLLSDILSGLTERYISYIECVIEAFCAHLYASSTHTILMIMAFDRYVAICNPLHYSTIMTHRMVGALSLSAWGVPMFLVMILIALSARLTRCRWVILNPICDNASLFKLSCENIAINNIYGLTYSVLLLGSSIGSVTLTYLRIGIVCLSSRNKALNSKALQTCTTHLTVYLILLLSGSLIIILHRFPDLSNYRKLAAVMFHVVPPVMNAVIYGLQIKALRDKICILFTRMT